MGRYLIVGRVALPTPTSPEDHPAIAEGPAIKLPLSLRGRKPAPQGGLSCPAGNSPSGNPFSFRPLRGRAVRCTAGDADCHGLRPRNDGGCFALVLLIWLCNCLTGSAWAVPHALQKTPDAVQLHRVFCRCLSAYTVTRQPLGSSSLPVWMPVIVSYSFWDSSPMEPPLMVMTSST